ncbi:RimJ/RimL family protein N-acetyltransferase [Kutzneria buriramensis]|uniref:RimJ/RimL family protein N-acetyltransferase n=2 Tax=Kutzneria buriramensis TaxID=1045776 RepID=A0A3E0I756_9PSEU|nr:RimJ/RimL family protein N-acetyltransferase [Kutzneria buriramensis]
MIRPMPNLREKPVLAGNLVLLRPVIADDAVDMLEVLADDDVLRLTGSHGTLSPDDLEPMRQWYGSRHEHEDRLDLAVVDRASGQYVGEVVLNELDVNNNSCSFRIALGARGQNRGLGTEATRLVLGYAFERIGLHRISLEVYAFNPRARRVYEKVGFRFEGVLRDALLWEGERFDAHVMSILAPEWAEHRGRPEAELDNGREAV